MQPARTPPLDDTLQERWRQRVKRFSGSVLGQVVILVLLVVVLVGESQGISSLSSTLPPTTSIAPESARLALQSVIALDGVMMGFTGILFGALIARESIVGRAFSLLISMIVAIVLFLLGVLNAFYVLLLVGGPTFVADDLLTPVGFTVYAITVLFYGIVLYWIRA